MAMAVALGDCTRDDADLLDPSSPVRLQDGAWFAADRERALLLARTRAGGMDIPAQEAATAAIAAGRACTFMPKTSIGASLCRPGCPVRSAAWPVNVDRPIEPPSVVIVAA